MAQLCVVATGLRARLLLFLGITFLVPSHPPPFLPLAFKDCQGFGQFITVRGARGQASSFLQLRKGPGDAGWSPHVPPSVPIPQTPQGQRASRAHLSFYFMSEQEPGAELQPGRRGSVAFFNHSPVSVQGRGKPACCPRREPQPHAGLEQPLSPHPTAGRCLHAQAWCLASHLSSPLASRQLHRCQTVSTLGCLLGDSCAWLGA